MEDNSPLENLLRSIRQFNIAKKEWVKDLGLRALTGGEDVAKTYDPNLIREYDQRVGGGEGFGVVAELLEGRIQEVSGTTEYLSIREGVEYFKEQEIATWGESSPKPNIISRIGYWTRSQKVGTNGKKGKEKGLVKGDLEKAIIDYIEKHSEQ